MSTDVRSVQSAKPDYVYGAYGAGPLKSGAAVLLTRAMTLVPSIPKGATITSATLRIYQYTGPWSGSVTLSAFRLTAPYKSTTTWNTQPTAAGAATATVTRVSSAANSIWDFDVTADVQAFIALTQPYYGWKITTNSATQYTMRTDASDILTPQLIVNYTVPAKVPASLSPQGGAVSVAKPVLTFSTGDDTTGVNVQVDAAANPGTAFDTGTITATAGVVDLNATAYAGLSNGATTYWRARAQTASGWSAWSSWVSFSRSNLSALSLSAPGAAPADTTPTLIWSFGGTQSAWEASLLDSTGKVVASSGVVAGAATSWTPSKGLSGNGATGTARIRVWDTTTRVATSGAPAYAEATQAFTVTLSGAVTPMTTLTATQSGPSPAVTLAGTRSTGGVPDEVVVYRNGFPVARMPGSDIFTSATAFSYTDWTAPVGLASTYRLAPVASGSVASGGPTAVITPDCDGIWLIDVAASMAVVLWGIDAGSWDSTDLATTLQPITEDAPVVRRRLRRGTLSGSLSGELVDVGSLLADTMISNLEVFRNNDAGKVYRLVAGHLNVPVIIGDILITPTPASTTTNTWARASFNFWTA